VTDDIYALREVDQTKFGDPDGDCFEACIASITSIPLDEIPHFLSQNWFEEYRGWLRKQGWKTAWWDAASGSFPQGLAIGNGKAERGLAHSVVCLDGELFHDPYPSRAGLLEVRYWVLLWK